MGDVSRDLVLFVQFEKHEKHPYWSVTLAIGVILLHGYFSRFLNYTDGTKSRNASHIGNPTLKAFFKWKNLPSMFIIFSLHEDEATFSFTRTEPMMVKKTHILNGSKPVQEKDLQVNVLKENISFFSEYIAKLCNKSLNNTGFPNCLKLANITPVF